jgi:ribosome modulation factor
MSVAASASGTRDFSGDSECARAFGRGCDARYRGRSVRSNPYTSTGQRTEYMAWQDGWRHCDRNWGIDAKWPVATLPPASSSEAA